MVCRSSRGRGSPDPFQLRRTFRTFLLYSRVYYGALVGETRMGNPETFLCQICKENKRHEEVVPAESVPDFVVRVIKKTHPWSSGGYICNSDLDHFRAQYVGEVLEREKEELAELQEQVTQSMKDHTLFPKNINVEFDRQLGFGERLSDKLADFAGSWTFILIFLGVLFVWIAINALIFVLRPFDPYPFIFLNLVLSALAAIQAPLIIMSQNRQEARDRLHAEHDYQVNLSTEMEIHQLHRKMDHLLINQGQRLLEIQNIQVELMQNLIRKIPGKSGG